MDPTVWLMVLAGAFAGGLAALVCLVYDGLARLFGDRDETDD